MTSTTVSFDSEVLKAPATLPPSHLTPNSLERNPMLPPELAHAPSSTPFAATAASHPDPAFPHFHPRPAKGWINDPNGVSFINGRYHVFFQYNPESARHNHICWGHVSSPDLVHWDEHPVALRPQPGGPDEFGCWSGVVTDDGGTPTAVYSGVRSGGGHSQVTLARGSADLVTWMQDGHVAASMPSDVTAVRDPFIFRFNGRRYAIQGAGLASGHAAVLLYSVDDIEDWKYEGIWLTTEHPVAAEFALAQIWECPQLVRVPASGGGGSAGAGTPPKGGAGAGAPPKGGAGAGGAGSSGAGAAPAGGAWAAGAGSSGAGAAPAGGAWAAGAGSSGAGAAPAGGAWAAGAGSSGAGAAPAGGAWAAGAGSSGAGAAPAGGAWAAGAGSSGAGAAPAGGAWAAGAGSSGAGAAPAGGAWAAGAGSSGAGAAPAGGAWAAGAGSSGAGAAPAGGAWAAGAGSSGAGAAPAGGAWAAGAGSSGAGAAPAGGAWAAGAGSSGAGAAPAGGAWAAGAGSSGAGAAPAGGAWAAGAGSSGAGAAPAGGAWTAGAGSSGAGAAPAGGAWTAGAGSSGAEAAPAGGAWTAGADSSGAEAAVSGGAWTAGAGSSGAEAAVSGGAGVAVSGGAGAADSGTGEDTWVMMFSLWVEGDEHEHASGVGHLIGALREDSATGLPMFIPRAGGRTDRGRDFYAPQVLALEDRALLWGWANEGFGRDGRRPRTQDQIDAAGWAGVLTFPRELSVVDDALVVAPARELDAYRDRGLAKARGGTVVLPFAAEAVVTPGNSIAADTGEVRLVLVKTGENGGYSGSASARAKGSAGAGGSRGVGGSESALGSQRAGGSESALGSEEAADFRESERQVVFSESLAADASLRIFVDASVVEVYRANGVATTIRAYPMPDEEWHLELPGRAHAEVWALGLAE